MNSLFDRESKPSLMLFIIEIHAPVIWLESRKSFEKLERFVYSYIVLVNFLASCQHSNSSNRLIFIFSLPSSSRPGSTGKPLIFPRLTGLTG